MFSYVVRRLPTEPASLTEAADQLCTGSHLSLDIQWPCRPERQPAGVWLGHTGGRVHVFARIPETVTVSHSTGHNQRMWLLGDTFEMFLQSVGSASAGHPLTEYVELHVTPNNHRLQLRFPSERVFREVCNDATFPQFLLPDPVFSSEVLQEPGGWSVFAVLPAELVGGSPNPLSGQSWRYSFCRYDYDRVPGEPVLSSTSRHDEADFHRIADWGTLEFE